MSSQLTPFLLNPAASRELALLAGHCGWMETLVLSRVLQFWQRYCDDYTTLEGPSTFTLWEFRCEMFKYPFSKNCSRFCLISAFNKETMLRILSIYHCINIKIEEPYPWCVAAAAAGLQQLGVGDQVQAQVQVVSPGVGSGQLRPLAHGTGQADHHHGCKEICRQ